MTATLPSIEQVMGVVTLGLGAYLFMFAGAQLAMAEGVEGRKKRWLAAIGSVGGAASLVSGVLHLRH